MVVTAGLGSIKRSEGNEDRTTRKSHWTVKLKEITHTHTHSHTQSHKLTHIHITHTQANTHTHHTHTS